MTENSTFIAIDPDKDKFSRSNFYTSPSRIVGLFPFSSYLAPSHRDASQIKWINNKLSVQGSICYALICSERVIACVFISKNAWDSSHFSGSFYHLDMYSEENVRKKSLVDLLLFSIKKTKEINEGSVHITCKIGGGCELLSEALLRAGFLSTGRQIILAAYRDKFAEFNFRCENRADKKILEYHADDLGGLGEGIAFPSRLYNDTAYNHEKIRQMNGEWIESIARLPLRDRTVLLYQKEGRNVGVAASRLVWSHGGLRVFGDSMFGFLPNEGRYIYDRLLTCGVSDSLRKCTVIECAVSETNKVFLNTLLRRGHEKSREVEVLTLSESSTYA